MKDRLEWVLRVAQRRRTTIEFRAPADTVAASLSANFQREFPSPKGQLVVAGHVEGADPIRVRLRIFPDGARVGMLHGGDRGRWMKTAVVGNLRNQQDGSEFDYRLVANGVPLLFALVGLVLLGLVVALVLAATGQFQPSLIALIVAAWLGGGTALVLREADQGIREERLVSEWLLTTLAHLR